MTAHRSEPCAPHERSGRHSPRRPAQIGERVVTVGIEPGRHEHPGRLEPVDGRSNDFVDGRQGDVAGRAGWQRHVHRQTRSTGTTRFCGVTRARIRRPLVQGGIENAGVVPEDVLRSVAVVHVPVDDRDALAASASAAAAIATLFNKQNPSHARVAWCPGGRTATKAAWARPSRNASTAANPSPAACVAVAHDPRGGGVGIQIAAARLAKLSERVEVQLAVDPGQLREQSRPSSKTCHTIFELGVRDAALDRAEASVPFGMTERRLVFVDLIDRPEEHTRAHPAISP